MSRRTDKAKNENENGLYQKYRVETANGDAVCNAFVLEPQVDSDARAAIRAYAEATDNEELAEDLRDWMQRIEERDSA